MLIPIVTWPLSRYFVRQSQHANISTMPCQFLPLPDHEIGILQLLGSPAMQIWVLSHANSYCYLAIKFGYGTLFSSPSMQIWCNAMLISIDTWPLNWDTVLCQAVLACKFGKYAVPILIVNSGKIKKETKCFSILNIYQMRKTQQNL